MNSTIRLFAALTLALALLACSKVTPENYERIREGMSETEVIAILGNPTDSSAVSILGLSGNTSTWTGSEYSITLQFVNGKLRLKSLARTDSAGKPAPR